MQVKLSQPCKVSWDTVLIRVNKNNNQGFHLLLHVRVSYHSKYFSVFFGVSAYGLAWLQYLFLFLMSTAGFRKLVLAYEVGFDVEHHCFPGFRIRQLGL